jgi:hypothetical protein
MLSEEALSEQLRTALGDSVRVRRKGIDRYLVRTPFTFPDGDHYVIVLRRSPDGAWYVTDEGHTLMHLSYRNVNLESAQRAEHVETLLRSCRVRRIEGELRVDVPGTAFGDALFSMVQAISQMIETARWTTERARSTFPTEFDAFVRKWVPAARLTPEFTDRARDPGGLYAVDFAISNSDVQLYVLGITSNAKCRDATITILEHRTWGRRFLTLAIFDNQLEIEQKVLARFTDAQQGRSCSSLPLARTIAAPYIESFLRHGLPEQMGN